MDQLPHWKDSMEMLDQSGAVGALPLEGDAMALPIDGVEVILGPVMLVSELLNQRSRCPGLSQFSFVLGVAGAFFQMELTTRLGKQRCCGVWQCWVVCEE